VGSPSKFHDDSGNLRRLARETKEEVSHAARHVEATQAQARIANEALQVANEQTGIAQRTLGAQIRPVLIDMPFERSVQDEIPGYRGSVHAGATSNGPVISLPVRNAGAGLAIIRGAGLRVGEPIPSPPVTITPANLPVGENCRINFAIPLDHPAAEPVQRVLRASGGFSIEIAYTDLAGQQLVVSRFDVYYHPQANWNWQVRQVHHLEPGMDEPFAGSAPTA
jgi:hypothetical protein